MVSHDIQSISIDPAEIEEILTDNLISNNEELLECCHFYFRLVYRILESINESNIDEESKQRYAMILRDSLVQSELTALVINGCTDESPKLNELLLRYDMMKNIELDRNGESRDWLRWVIEYKWKAPRLPAISTL
jgi:hypothetical protein